MTIDECHIKTKVSRGYMTGYIFRIDEKTNRVKVRYTQRLSHAYKRNSVLMPSPVFEKVNITIWTRPEYITKIS